MMMPGRPVPSPGRVENYPPPLMRFIRSKSSGGSRSRGRSRTSPMFLRQKKSSAAVETQEPSSPKVTCMGQVRVRRSKQPGTLPGSAEKPSSRCRWLRNALLCYPCAGKHKTTSCSQSWRNWVSFSSSRIRRKAKGKANSTGSQPDIGVEPGPVPEIEGENEGDNEIGVDIPNASVSPVSTPPRNALLLTRSRSAPYRSSSLACRFWGSPVTEQEEAKPGTDERNKEEEENPKSKTELFLRESDQESRIDSGTDGKIEFSWKIECKVKENDSEPANKKEDRTEESELRRMKPLILTRCKSLPARIRESGPREWFMEEENMVMID